MKVDALKDRLRQVDGQKHTTQHHLAHMLNLNLLVFMIRDKKARRAAGPVTHAFPRAIGTGHNLL